MKDNEKENKTNVKKPSTVKKETTKKTVAKKTSSNVKKNGVKTSLVFISYGFIRFIIEFFRIRENIIGPFSISHIFAIITIIIGIVIYYLYNIKKCEESKK